MADALDLGSSGATREGSNPFARTMYAGALRPRDRKYEILEER